MTTTTKSVTVDDGTATVTVAVSLVTGGVVVVPPTGGLVVPANANAVRVLGTERQFPLAAVDPAPGRNSYPGERGPGELILYTRRSGVWTMTNEFGWEAELLPGGLAGAGGQNHAYIPADGGVLSGHDTGTPDCAAAFVKGLKAGDKIEFVHLTIAPPVTPPSGHGKLAAWVVASYWQQYQGPKISEVLASAPGNNLLIAAFATGGGGQNMTFSPRTCTAYAGSNGDDVFTTDVAAVHASGRRMGISLGGGVKPEAATVLRTDAEGKAVFEGMKKIIDKYGFSAIDIDTENGPAGFTYEGMHGLLARIRDTCGPDFAITCAPRPYEDFYYDILGRLVAQEEMDLVQHQFYDAPEYKSAAFLVDHVRDRAENARRRGVPVDRQVVGTIIWSGYPYGWNTMDNYLLATLPIQGIRGLMTWETSLDQKMGWIFASKAAAAAPKVTP